MKKLLVSILAIGVANSMFAYILEGHHGPSSSIESRAAGCAPANDKIFLEFNNVRALIETGGSLWTDRSRSRAAYEYPKGSGNHVLFAGALWMGGEDINGQLKLAAHRFREGNDFWAGPLGQLDPGTGNYDPFVPQNPESALTREYGGAEVFSETCVKYDRFFTIRKSEVMQFIAWWECENGVSNPEDCEGVTPPSDEAMDRIRNWPAHGNKELGQDYYLAPFYDNALPGEVGNGDYRPMEDGDYPWYDDILGRDDIECKKDRRISLFGDETHWWVFNDKGNIHTETGGEPIGMEVRAQAFAFATDDEVNDMTFYNYELINRGTQTLYNTYFGQYADPDIGLANNDLVGCDVARGLGYAYNGTSTDPGQGGQPGYGSNPPAVGIDFFEGPYKDNDFQDNPLTEDVALAFAEGGIPYEGLGIGYGDEIPDNERFGMQRFVYYNNATGPYGDPNSATDYYGYLKGIWKNGIPMQYGGNGQTTGSGVPSRYMYPGDSDPLGWSTYPAPLPFAGPWSEISEDNPPEDRRFVQSAGPFTLKPGAVNNITVGVVVGQSSDSDLEAPIRALRQADTKAQVLFNECFKLLEPPVAPILTIQEMENELLLFLSNPPGLARIEDYEEADKLKIPQDPLPDGTYYDDKYRFEGYQIYQMVDDEASVTDIGDLSKARLVAQTDIVNGVGRLVNYTLNEELGFLEPELVVESAGEFPLDKGLRHSFKITEDLFATGADRVLVNHKKYYYIAVSYAYNNYKTYDPTSTLGVDGQKRPYLRSRISGTGGSIESVIAIPHDPSPEAEGRVFTTAYGYQPEIKQLEGLGNGGNFLELTDQTVSGILASNGVSQPTYKVGSGPIGIKVVDPLTLKAGDYRVGFTGDSTSFDNNTWWIERSADGKRDTVFSEASISVDREQLILEWGISVTIDQQQIIKGSIPASNYVEPIGATITYADSSKRWLFGVEDSDNFYPSNWIRSGSSEEAANHIDASSPSNPGCVASNWIYQPCHYDDVDFIDSEGQKYEQLLGGTIAPFRLVGKGAYGSPYGFPGENTTTPWYESNESWFTTASAAQSKARIDFLHDVDIIFTSNKDLWTRCPVIEINDNRSQTEHNDYILEPRGDLSVDKNGLSAGQPGYNPAEGDLVNATGMGWFPGYAIDVNTGERLNMIFGENSWLTGENGRDMIWNPTSSISDAGGDPLFGGMHYIYVFGANVDGGIIPAYDQGATLREYLEVDEVASASTRSSNYLKVWSNCFWVMEPLLAEDQELLSTDVKVSARIQRPYERHEVGSENNGYPLYGFSFENPSITGNSQRLISVIDNINVVPNPYYAYSSYETSKLDNRVKITNLPEKCEITIFNMRGALVRSFKKDDPLTSIDWDLKNHRGVPIAGGIYLIHVKIEVEEDGGKKEYEKVLKFYGALRQPDLDNL